MQSLFFSLPLILMPQSPLEYIYVIYVYMCICVINVIYVICVIYNIYVLYVIYMNVCMHIETLFTVFPK